MNDSSRPARETSTPGDSKRQGQQDQWTFDVGGLGGLGGGDASTLDYPVQHRVQRRPDRIVGGIDG